MKKQLSRYILAAVFVLQFFTLMACSSQPQKSQSLPASASSPSLTVSINQGQIEITGLDCDMMSADNSNGLYLANVRFIPAFADAITEGSARLDAENNLVTVRITKSTVSAGAITGPTIEFSVNIETNKLISSSTENYEADTITIPEEEQIVYGKLLASVIIFANASRPVFAGM